MPIPSETTLTDLQQQQFTIQHQIHQCETALQQAIRKYTLTSENDPHHRILFGEAYYLNELLGYLREQHSLIQRYIGHLEDDGPDAEWDTKAFWDYPGDQQLKAKCLETVHNPYFGNLWLKEIQFIIKSYSHHKNGLNDLNHTNPEDQLQVVQECQQF